MSIAGSSDYSDTSSESDVVESWKPQQQRHRRTTLPELLQLRQTYGLNQQRKLRGRGIAYNPRNPHHVASTSYLSYRGAWNATRMQNAILVVGPGTPASTIRESRTTSGTSNDDDNESSNSASEAEDGGNMDSSEDEDSVGSNERMDEDDSQDPPDSDDDDIDTEGFYEFLRNNYGPNSEEEEEGSSSEGGSTIQGRVKRKSTINYRPSMRHGGCINTAAWLTSDCGWRLSTVSSDVTSSGVCAVETEELPTQVVTSGDDRLLKVWDVSEPMGTTSPLAGGTATLTPFSSSCDVENNFYTHKEQWQSIYDARRKSHDGDEYRPPGTVRLLATVSTGHRGNVFHVTPLKGRPGVFATCGADGFLRLVDIERSSGQATSNGSGNSDNSTVVIHPMYDHNSDGNPRLFDPENPLAYFLRNSSGMCFSHQMLDDANVGLLCSEKGLLRFDLRLSPREQCTRSLLPKTERSSGTIVRSIRACKACTILPTSSSGAKENSLSGSSTYVFAGGSSPAVALCDLRMSAASTDQRSSRVLQYYKPMSLSDEHHVSVSGLDLSHDGKELLVSYESDQIYTFPVFPYSQSPRRSATDQLVELLNKDALDNDDNREEDRLYPWGQGKRILPELAAYGAHLNRYTFLKNARYAGPRDEYICTGSDSGHAWIYEKATGAVVSFWRADQSTCNGVVPHPTLPIFVTYGIDSTAKLWRSTIPVDSEVDDSVIGRRNHFRKTQEQSYEMTPTVRHWGEVRSILENLDLREAGMTSEDSAIFPDQIPCSKVLRRGRLAQTWARQSSSSRRQGIPNIANNLHNLPDVLKGNLYTVLRSLFDDNDVPVESDTEDFKRRISLIRLRHQADSLGLSWNPTIPWLMEGRPTIRRTQETLKDSPEDHEVEPSELVPEYPSDWIPYDADMSNHPYDFRYYFCSKYAFYTDFYRDRYYALDERGGLSVDSGIGSSDDTDDNDAQSSDCADHVHAKECGETSIDVTGNDMEDESLEENESGAGTNLTSKVEDEDEDEMDGNEESSQRKDIVCRSDLTLLAETVKTLKDGGNAAFKAGKVGLAAYRYDKAIQYGSVPYMNNRKISPFNDLLKNLIMTRLNMVLVLRNDHFMEFKVATQQAKLALQEVSPYCDPDNSESPDELDEALALKAKACFRLGSTQYEMGDYDDAIASLEESIRSTKDISNPQENTPDSVVVRRLAQAKRELVKHTKRQRKKFKFAFSPSGSDSGSVMSTETPSTVESTALQHSLVSPPTGISDRGTETEPIGVALTVSNPATLNITTTVTPINSPEAQPRTNPRT